MRRFFTAGLVVIVLIASFAGGLDIAKAEQYKAPVLDADAAVLMDASTGQVLFAKNKDKRQFPASITKVMTGMLALENADPREFITMSRQAVFSISRGSSHIALDTDEVLSLEDALYALSIESANDAGNGIAECISGSCEEFAALMNERARELGALNTNFVNAHGLGEPEHYTTAYDMALIMRQAIKDPRFQKIFSAGTYTMAPTNLQTEAREFHSKNLFLNGGYDFAGITASKLGWTSQANNTLITSALRDGRELIAVVMNSTAHRGTYLDTMALFEFGFNDFQPVTVLTANDEKSLALGGQGEESITVKSHQDVVRLLHKSVFPGSVRVNYAVADDAGQSFINTEVSFRLAQPSQYMYEDLGKVTIATPITPPAQADEPGAGILGGILATVFQGVKTIFFILLGLAALILLLRQVNQVRLHRKRMARRRQYRIDYIDHNMNRGDKNQPYRKSDHRDYDR